jgi:hypothetical protein
MLPAMVNSYIVRIYREEKNNPQAFVGVVENIEQQGKRAFTNVDELWAILNPAEKEKENGAKAGGNRARSGIPKRNTE